MTDERNLCKRCDQNARVGGSALCGLCWSLDDAHDWLAENDERPMGPNERMAQAMVRKAEADALASVRRQTREAMRVYAAAALPLFFVKTMRPEETEEALRHVMSLAHALATLEERYAGGQR